MPENTSTDQPPNVSPAENTSASSSGVADSSQTQSVAPGNVVVPPMPDNHVSGLEGHASAPGEPPHLVPSENLQSTLPQNNMTVTPQMSSASPGETSYNPSGNSKLPKILLVVLFGVLIIGGMAAGGYYLGMNQSAPSPTPQPTLVGESTPQPSKTPDPTADWKTYSSSDFGFLIKYPDNLEVKEDNKANTVQFLEAGEAQIEVVKDSSKPKVKSIAEYLGEGGDLELSSMKMGEFEWFYDKASKEPLYYLLNGKDVYTVFLKDQSWVNLVLPTFQIVEPTPSPSVKDQ